MITQAKAKDMFEYRDGWLYWKVPRSRGVKAGDRVGAITKRGYAQTAINGKSTSVHRLVFLLHHGYLPKQIDHIDGDKANNRIENLRDVTTAQNNSNRGTPINNTSGVKGVCWHKSNKKWVVSLSINKTRRYFGAFDDMELAELVANEARSKYHGEYARHN